MMARFESLMQKAKKLPVFVYLTAVLLVLFIFGGLTIDGFFSPSTIVAILVLTAFLGIASGGQTFVIVLGAIDLSIPSMIGVANVLVGYLSGLHWPFFYIVLTILAVAIVLGTVNALASKTFDVYPLITTMATGAIAQGGIFVLTGGRVTASGPMWLNQAVALNGHMGFIPLPPIIGVWAVYSIIALLLLFKTPWGKRLYASGVSDRAAQLALVNTTSVWIVSFIISAISAAITGVLLAGFSGSAFFSVGAPYLFTTLGAVVLGGTSLLGGRGGYGRTIFGSLLMTLITTLMIGYGFDEALQQAFLGFVIIVLLGMYGRQQNLNMRM